MGVCVCEYICVYVCDIREEWVQTGYNVMWAGRMSIQTRRMCVVTDHYMCVLVYFYSSAVVRVCVCMCEGENIPSCLYIYRVVAYGCRVCVICICVCVFVQLCSVYGYMCMYKRFL